MEVVLLEKLRGISGCIQLLSYFLTPSKAMIVMERPPRGILLEEYLRKGCLNVSLIQRKVVFCQIVRAVTNAFSKGVVHRDLKSDNILVDNFNLAIWLIDFGCGDLIVNEPYSKCTGCIDLAPPEYYLTGLYYAEPSTVWALGILFYYILFLDIPFRSKEEILKESPAMSSLRCTSSKNLILSCLHKDPSKRVVLKEIDVDSLF